MEAIQGDRCIQLPEEQLGAQLDARMQGPAYEELEDDDQEEYEDSDEQEQKDEDSDEDRREFGIYQCLPVEPGEPDWESGEAQTVEEYLRRVRYEARQLPDVVTRPPAPFTQQHASDAPHTQHGNSFSGSGSGAGGGSSSRRSRFSRYLAADPGVTACDASLKPSAAWTRDFLRQFARLRRRLQREHELTNELAAAEAAGGAAGGVMLADGLRISPQLLGSGGGAGAGAGKGAGGGGIEGPVELEEGVRRELEALRLDPPSAVMPELMQLQGLDQLQVRRQLHAAIQAVVREGEGEGGGGGSVAPEAAAQLYALSARIEKPLHAGTCALYRQLLRLCAAQRAALTDAAHPLLPHLNILIIVAGAFFSQDEELAAMWDDDEAEQAEQEGDEAHAWQA